ncbi:MAG TPA: hypothetical protein VMG31_07370 [Verrucomicrobiae bacterium]|nr:hypothetical protein [Verrucomicrobiae bacterium]
MPAGFQREIELLSQLALAGEGGDAVGALTSASDETRAAFVKLAHGHHVVIRALRPLQGAASAAGATELADWSARSLEKEESRIENALEFLHAICGELESAGCATTVMKSLDHWPDIGNDLDLYTEAEPAATRRVMQERFRASAQPRTWGDRLAQKCGYRVPGLRATVEIHHGRLGQTGEHRALARRFVTRRISAQFGAYRFWVPAPEERVIAATLQRMYRHLYVRVCDVANTAGLVEAGEIHYAELRSAAKQGGIWPGVVTYLKIVADYSERYRARPLALPEFIAGEAVLDGRALFVRGTWLRVPVFPGVASLYGRQMGSMLWRGDVPGAFRLGLLPPLASVATLAYKITGSPRGIW